MREDRRGAPGGLGDCDADVMASALARLRDSADWFEARGETWLRCEALFWIGCRLISIGSIQWNLLQAIYDEVSAAVDSIGDLEGRSSRAWLGLWVARWRGDRDGIQNALEEIRGCDDLLGLGRVPAALRELADEYIVEESIAIATRPRPALRLCIGGSAMVISAWNARRHVWYGERDAGMVAIASSSPRGYYPSRR
ncbi:MAG: hypothetical protein KKA67_01770 [Spirochaetes bacterium]|nr:hypothetical protein [Spirochaetota bacterium]MBU1080001.1 hypothetical protein [Spirochaetota bacterium]